jgi:hypothetical protein
MKLGNLGIIVLVILFFCFPSTFSSQITHRKLSKIIISWIAIVERLPQDGTIVMLKENSKIRIVRYNGRSTLEKYSKSTHWAVVQLMGR